MSVKEHFNNIAEIQLVFKHQIPVAKRPRVQGSKHAYEIFRSVWDENRIELQEDFKVMLLDGSKRCMGVTHIATGGIDSALVDLKLVFAAAIKSGACSIILAHNHPSGDKTPSLEDEKMTMRCDLVANLLDIKLTDHIIVTRDNYCSLKDEGLMR